MTKQVSRLDDSDMQAVPIALARASERARRLARQTGTHFIVRSDAKPGMKPEQGSPTIEGDPAGKRSP